MAESDPGAVEIEIWIEATPETVFAFLTDPEKLVRWIGLNAWLEPHPGGRFKIDVNNRDVVLGEYKEVIPPRRVVFTWGWEGGGGRVPPGSTTVEIDLWPDGGGTRLRLRHSGLTGRDRDKHAAGWAHYARRLAQSAAGHDPGPDPLASPEIVHG